MLFRDLSATVTGAGGAQKLGPGLSPGSYHACNVGITFGKIFGS